jgi:hypothetical protein
MPYEPYWEHAEPVLWPYYMVGAVMVVIIFALLVNTIQTVFDRLSPDLRVLSAAQLWVTIIPVFGSFWIFYVVYQLAGALREEFRRRNVVEFETYPGLGTGWAFSFFAFTTELMLTLDAPVVTLLLAILSVILLVAYWMKVAEFRRKLDDHARQMHSQQMPPPYTFYPPQYPPPADTPPPPPQQDDAWNRWRPK